MNDEEKLAADESRKLQQHEAVKGDVRQKVHAEISRQADDIQPREQHDAEVLAASLKHKAVREVAETETQIDRTRSERRRTTVDQQLPSRWDQFMAAEPVRRGDIHACLRSPREAPSSSPNLQRL